MLVLFMTVVSKCIRLLHVNVTEMWYAYSLVYLTLKLFFTAVMYVDLNLPPPS